MGGEIADGYIKFENPDELVSELQSSESFISAIAPYRKEQQAEILKGFDNSLVFASKSDINKPTGEPKVKIGDWHIRLRLNFWEVIKTGGSMIITIYKLTHGGDVKDTAGAVINAFDEVVKRISLLKVDEVIVYEAIVSVIDSKWDKTLVIPGASEKELSKWMTRKKINFPSKQLNQTLSSLKNRQIIEVVPQVDDELYYVPVF
jgi:hypothetical protein